MPPEKDPYTFWQETLHGARYIVAPMVDASELAWRLLSRRHGAQLCYTPMLHSASFVKDAKYRRDALQSCDEDRPLFIQFCANKPDVLLKAVKMVEGHCDAVDLNLGCPQAIAKRGHYGAFLQDDWDLVYSLVRTVYEGSKLPITCKVRVFPDIDKTVRYAQMLESAGAQIITVHGRTREQKGRFTGLASWAHVKAVKKAVKIPVFSNGNIQYLSDVERCLKETGVDGVMTAEGNLHNPALFQGLSPPVWEMAKEYMTLVRLHPCPISFIRGHLFKLFQHCMLLKECKDLRDRLATRSTYEDLLSMVEDVEKHFHLYHDGSKELDLTEAVECVKKLREPIWLCQPYERPQSDISEPQAKKPKQEETSDCEVLPPGLSKNKLKKLQRYPNKQFRPRVLAPKCIQCANPRGEKCERKLCRVCCKSTCYSESLDCNGHRIWIGSKRQQALISTQHQVTVTL
ncbi:unnamed protein product [Darwinula stevensoni]|uniref:tRNA-dihydrouridine(16/17) synthase [NAD(P)(+)]-like n=1 Tax=Darwinula stevensoni TaxID=69355 RepID=A0A7R9A0Q7_9CRUS|nr:unnamed protein product [Darwinula stevensoni]CAG0881742.1 unnamed protein product [Darwinula stevensoni]